MKEMHILCSTDRNFLYPTYVTMCSVMENHPSIHVNFYLFTGEDVTPSDKEDLRKYIESKGNNITYIDVSSSLYENYVLCERFPLAAYYRLLAHEYLPKTVDRVLYIDVDLVVNTNIYDDFYNLDFDGKFLIATSHNPDPSYFNAMTDAMVNLEAAAKGEFFNSGVLLMNLELFRRANITIEDYNRAYQSCVDNGIQVFYDQGLLNYMFYNKTIYLSSMDYNYRYSIPRDYMRRLNPNIEYKKAIIHYTGMKQPYKPWDLRLTSEEIERFGDVPYQTDYFYVSQDLNDLMEIWWKYAKKTPVYDLIEHDTAVKTKWFRRNLLDFTIKHNKMLKEYKNSKIIEKVIYKDKANAKVYEEFHPRAYKLGCAIAKPYWMLKKLFKRGK